MKIILFFLVAIFSLPVFAQDISLAPECKILKEHVPNSDVAYKSGVDVSGNSVVPADINAPVIDVPETMVVPLSIDLRKGLEGATDKGVELKGTTGFLEISKNGRVTYNGADVTPQVYTLCGQNPPVSSDGQNEADIIKSNEPTHESIK